MPFHATKNSSDTIVVQETQKFLRQSYNCYVETNKQRTLIFGKHVEDTAQDTTTHIFNFIVV